MFAESLYNKASIYFSLSVTHKSYNYQHNVSHIKVGFHREWQGFFRQSLLPCNNSLPSYHFYYQMST